MGGDAPSRMDAKRRQAISLESHTLEGGTLNYSRDLLP